MSIESVHFVLEAVDGRHDARRLKQELDTFPGVVSVSINAAKNSLAVNFDSDGVGSGRLSQAIDLLGYTIVTERTNKRKK